MADAIDGDGLGLAFLFFPKWRNLKMFGVVRVSGGIASGEARMSAPLRILSLAAFLIADLCLPAGAAQAADRGGMPAYRTARHHHRWAVPDVLVAGVRGATPLTVPFFGSNWYPGPVYYYGPPPRPCFRGREDAVISARY